MDTAPTLTNWLGQLWSRRLFPGPPRAADPPRPVSLLILLILPALLLYPSLGFRLIEPDESRYAQIPREMLQRGDLVVPTLQGEPYLDKPPLFYWLVMLSYRAFGVHDWAARLVPAVAVHLTILVTYLLGRRALGERAAFAAALVLTLAPGFVTVSRLLILDGLLTLCVAVSLFASFEAVRGERLRWPWWLLAALATGLGVLTKGPVAAPPARPAAVAEPPADGRQLPPGWRAWAAFLAVVLALALPWYVALSWRLPGFIGYFFWEHNLQRFLDQKMHTRGVWFYAPVLWLMLLPAALLLLPLLRFLFSLDESVAQRRPAELGFCLLAGGWCVFFFTLSSCKLPTYILPALPFLALVIGAFLVETGWARTPLVRGVAVAGMAFVLFAHHLALPWYAGYRSPMSRPAEVLALCADRSTPVVCFPRNCDSVAFYLGRDDLHAFRSKDIEELRTLVRVQPRTVILCTHRHSLAGLKQLLPPEVRIAQECRMGLADIHGVPPWAMKPLAKLMGETALGLADLAVIEMPPLLGKASPAAEPAGLSRRGWHPSRRKSHHD
ncbi:MAG: glycosyltransferase family 39 protein [Gemmataceae bacterium]